MNPYAKTHEMNVALSFYRVREAIAAKIIAHHFINGKMNHADILGKDWVHHSVCSTLRPLLFWKGDTM